MSQFLDQISGKCVIVFCLQLQTKLLIEVIDQYAPVQPVFILADRFNFRHNFFILFIDIAHNLLNQVFDRDNSGKSAVLIYQDCHMASRFLHSAEKFIRLFRLWYKKRFMKHFPDIHLFRTVLPQLDHHVLNVKNTDDIVYIFLIDRYPVVSCLKDLVDKFLKRLVNVNCNNITPWHHDFPCRPVIERKNRIYHLAFVIIKRSAFISHLQKCLDFFFGNCLFLVFRFHMKNLQYQLCGN